MVSCEPRWRESRPAWKLLRQRVGGWRLAGALLFTAVTAAGRSWCQIWQLSALTALYNALVLGSNSPWEALRGYLVATILVLLLFLVRQGGSIALELQWRRLLTSATFERYLATRAYLHSSSHKGLDHPDQRMTEDAAEMAGQTTTLAMSFVSESIRLCSFLVVLAGASRFLAPGWPIEGVLWGPEWAVPIGALVVALLGTVGGLWLGRRLALWENNKEQREAALRRNCLLLKEHGPQIASLSEESFRASSLEHDLTSTVQGQGLWLFARMRLEAFRITERDLTKLLPLAVVAWTAIPGLTMGHVIQLVGAFLAVVESGQWLLRNLSSVRTLKAASWRLGTLLDSFEQPKTPASSSPLAPLAQQLLINAPSSSRWIFITGPSGSGKSTLLKDLWERLPRTVIVPHAVTVPFGSLRQWLVGDSSISPDLQAHLQHLGLARLIPLLEEKQAWGQRLSAGEQQRLGLLRAVLLQPDWLLLDEPFAWLDPATASSVQRWIQDQFTGRIAVASLVQPAPPSTPDRYAWAEVPVASDQPIRVTSLSVE